MESNTSNIKDEVKNEVKEVLAEGNVYPVAPLLPDLCISAIDVINYFRQAAIPKLHSNIKFRQTVYNMMPIKIKLNISKPYHQHLFGLNPCLVDEKLAKIIFGEYLKKTFEQQSYTIIQVPLLVEWKIPKKAI
jgi:hypothetical protein